jgi:hypothetical protein
MAEEKNASQGARMRTSDPLRGHFLAALNMVVSGVAVYINSLGVGSFGDSTIRLGRTS